MGEPLISSISNWPYTGDVAFALGIILAVIGIIATYRALKNKKPVYAIISQILIQNFDPLLPNLSIKFKGENVKNLSISRIAFWNDGKETINKTDISQAEPLMIEITKGCRILDVKLILTSNTANQFELLEIQDTYVMVSFDFLDYQDGALIQIIHDATVPKSLEVRGVIKGAGIPQHKNIRTKLLGESRIPFIGKIQYSQRYLGYVMAGVMWLFWLLLLGGLFLLQDGFNELPMVIFWGVFTIFLTYVAIPRIPKKFEIIEQLDRYQ
jgi:hypothetical protein